VDGEYHQLQLGRYSLQIESKLTDYPQVKPVTTRFQVYVFPECGKTLTYDDCGRPVDGTFIKAVIDQTIAVKADGLVIPEVGYIFAADIINILTFGATRELLCHPPVKLRVKDCPNEEAYPKQIVTLKAYQMSDNAWVRSDITLKADTEDLKGEHFLCIEPYNEEYNPPFY